MEELKLPLRVERVPDDEDIKIIKEEYPYDIVSYTYNILDAEDKYIADNIEHKEKAEYIAKVVNEYEVLKALVGASEELKKQYNITLKYAKDKIEALKEKNEKLKEQLELKQGQISRQEVQIDAVEEINERIKKVKVERYFEIKDLTIKNHKLQQQRDKLVELMEKIISEAKLYNQIFYMLLPHRYQEIKHLINKIKEDNNG